MLARLKFDLDSLSNELLDHLPVEVFKSSTTTFMDPCMGGGQFVAAIENRLRLCGHSDENIAQRVFGVESSRLRINYAINTHKLVGQYSYCENYLEYNEKMKFDVVIGNPPYQSGKGEKGGSSSIWRKFVRKGWSLVKPNGKLSYVVPRLPNSSKDIGEIFHKHQTEIVWDNINHYFPNVGSTFYAWIVSNTPKFRKTHFINQDIYVDITNDPLPRNIRSLDVVKKILQNKVLFTCHSSSNYFHTQIADGKNEEYLSSKKSKKLNYKLRRTTGENYFMWGRDEPSDYYKNKVCFTFSGYPHYKYHDKNDPIGTIKFQSGHILVNNEIEGANLIRLYKSKLYRFIMDEMSTGGMRGKKIYELPKLDINRNWSDQDIYEYFNLTQDEIDYVEENSK